MAYTGNEMYMTVGPNIDCKNIVCMNIDFSHLCYSDNFVWNDVI